MLFTTTIIIALSILSQQDYHATALDCVCGRDEKSLSRMLRMQCNGIDQFDGTPCGSDTSNVLIGYVNSGSALVLTIGSLQNFTGLSVLYLKNNDQRLKRLVIPPNEFRHLISLDTLSIQGFILSTENLRALSAAPALGALYLENVDLREIDQGQFRELRNLTSLILQNVYLSEITADGIQILSNLGRLTITDTPIRNVSTDFGDQLTKVRQLDLKRTLVEDVNWIRGMTSIWTLTLRRNKIKSLQPGLFNSMPILFRIDLSRNQIEALPPGLFGRSLPNITFLDLSFNKINRIAPGMFDNLPNLRTLDLKANMLASVPDGLFEGTKWGTINLRANLIQGIPRGMFRGLTGHVNLDLECNNISMIEPNAFDALVNASSVRLTKNPIKVLPYGLFAYSNCRMTVHVTEGAIENYSGANLTSCPHCQDGRFYTDCKRLYDLPLPFPRDCEPGKQYDNESD